MRICQGLLCDNAADLYWHGPWCAACAFRRYGRVPAEMFKIEIQNLPDPLTSSGAGRAAPVAAPSGSGDGPRAVTAPVLTFDELEEVLALDGWGVA